MNKTEWLENIEEKLLFLRYLADSGQISQLARVKLGGQFVDACYGIEEYPEKLLEIFSSPQYIAWRTKRRLLGE